MVLEIVFCFNVRLKWSLCLFSATGAIGTENESLCEESAMFLTSCPQESIGRSVRVLMGKSPASERR